MPEVSYKPSYDCVRHQFTLLDSYDCNKLRAALDVLRLVKTRSTDEVGMFSDDNAIDCCDRAIDAIIDLFETGQKF